jgi:hypothetical protein
MGFEMTAFESVNQIRNKYTNIKTIKLGGLLGWHKISGGLA